MLTTPVFVDDWVGTPKVGLGKMKMPQSSKFQGFPQLWVHKFEASAQPKPRRGVSVASRASPPPRAAIGWARPDSAIHGAGSIQLSRCRRRAQQANGV